MPEFQPGHAEQTKGVSASRLIDGLDSLMLKSGRGDIAAETMDDVRDDLLGFLRSGNDQDQDDCVSFISFVQDPSRYPGANNLRSIALSDEVFNQAKTVAKQRLESGDPRFMNKLRKHSESQAKLDSDSEWVSSLETGAINFFKSLDARGIDLLFKYKEPADLKNFFEDPNVVAVIAEAVKTAVGIHDLQSGRAILDFFRYNPALTGPESPAGYDLMPLLPKILQDSEVVGAIERKITQLRGLLLDRPELEEQIDYFDQILRHAPLPPHIDI